MVLVEIVAVAVVPDLKMPQTLPLVAAVLLVMVLPVMLMAVAADVAAKAAQVPTSQRQTCFIIGGVPYELAKAVRQGQEQYTVLKAPDDYAQLEGAKLKAGVTIYRALAAATGCQQFVFGWDTNFTIGYLLTLPQ